MVIFEDKFGNTVMVNPTQVMSARPYDPGADGDDLGVPAIIIQMSDGITSYTALNLTVRYFSEFVNGLLYGTRR